MYGIELTQLLTRSALESPSADSSEFLQRIAHALETLTTCFPATRFDLRLLSDSPVQARVLILSSTPVSDWLGVFEHHLPELSWAALSSTDLAGALEPFELRDAVLLERAVTEPNFDIAGGAGGAGGAGSGVLWNVHQPRIGCHDWPRLMGLLAAAGQRVLLSVRFQAAQTTLKERSFPLEQIQSVTALFERGASLEHPLFKPALSDLSAWHARLIGACAISTITVASDALLSAPLLYELRRLLVGKASLLEVVALDEVERTGLRAALTSLELVSSLYSKAPLGLERLPLLFSPLELASLVPLPDPPLLAIAGLPCSAVVRRALRVDLPSGLRIGVNRAGRTERPVRLSRETLEQHVYVVGKTRTGKTTALAAASLEAMEQGLGVVVIDPHGDLHQDLLARVPAHRRSDVIVIDPSSEDCVSINPFDVRGLTERKFTAMAFGEILQRLTEDEYGASAGTFMGPRFHQEIRMAIQLITSNPKQPGTIEDLYKFFTVRDYYQKWDFCYLNEPDLIDWNFNQLSRMDYQNTGNDNFSVGTWIASKFQLIAFHPMLQRVFGQPHATLNLEQALNSNKIILVNLAKGVLGEAASRFLGMVLMHMLYQALLKRAALEPRERRPVLMVIDEFHSIASQSFIGLLSEGRKFGAMLMLANQFLGQMRDPRVIQSILGNVGTLIAFRVSAEDGSTLESEFSGAFKGVQLSQLPNWTAAVRTLHAGALLQPFTLETLPLPALTVQQPVSLERPVSLETPVSLATAATFEIVPTLVTEVM